VRQSGTVGSDETVLRSTLPAARPTTGPSSERGPGDETPGRSHAGAAADRSGDALLALRSADDSDEGWGGPAGRDDNDDRLARDRPPHW